MTGSARRQGGLRRRRQPRHRRDGRPRRRLGRRRQRDAAARPRRPPAASCRPPASRASPSAAASAGSMRKLRLRLRQPCAADLVTADGQIVRASRDRRTPTCSGGCAAARWSFRQRRALPSGETCTRPSGKPARPAPRCRQLEAAARARSRCCRSGNGRDVNEPVATISRRTVVEYMRIDAQAIRHRLADADVQAAAALRLQRRVVGKRDLERVGRTDARSRARVQPRAHGAARSCHSATIAATRGSTDVTLSSGNGGRQRNGSWLPSSACGSMWCGELAGRP